MSKQEFSVSRTMDGQPEKFYSLIADYKESHPLILPPQFLSDLTVEEGGYGAGTIIRFKTHLLGRSFPTRGIVSEPKPGKVILEEYPDQGLATSFTVRAVNASRTQVTITTRWQPSRNPLQRLFQALFPKILRSPYQTELRRLDILANRGTQALASS